MKNRYKNKFRKKNKKPWRLWQTSKTLTRLFFSFFLSFFPYFFFFFFSWKQQLYCWYNGFDTRITFICLLRLLVFTHWTMHSPFNSVIKYSRRKNYCFIYIYHDQSHKEFLRRKFPEDITREKQYSVEVTQLHFHSNPTYSEAKSSLWTVGLLF